MSADFAPVNLLEQALIKAAEDPVARPVFLRELLDSEILVVPIGEVPPIVNGFVQADTKITLANVEYNGNLCVAFFTSEARLSPQTKFLIINTKAFFEMTRGAFVFLNPGAAYGKEFRPDEIARILDGSIFQPIERYVVEKETQVIIGQPKIYPQDLIEVLTRLYQKTPVVERAWIAFYHNPTRDKEGCLLLCIDTNKALPFDRVESDSGMIFENVPKKQGYMDIVRYTGNGLTSYFTKAAPFYRRNQLGRIFRNLIN